MNCTVAFAFSIGDQLRVKTTRLTGKVTAMLINAQGWHLVQIRDAGGTYHWQREEELQRVES